MVPEDFEKWARICEHIIMHYNEGWADGFYYNIEYWEIWNEPDLNEDDAENKLTWGGTKKQFFSFYDIVANYLKKRFPELKIGGPASCGNLAWMEDFLAQLNAPLDFFSFHMYAYEPRNMVEYAATVKNLLIKYGFGKVETILNEWNYVKNWQNRGEYVTAIHGMTGAAYAAATMCAMQNSGYVDMLMYYDARLYTPWNGLFDFYTGETLNTYHVMWAFGQLYRLGKQVVCQNDDDDLIITGATDGDTCAAMLAYYTPEAACEKTVILNTGLAEPMTCYLLDETCDMTPIGNVKDGDRLIVKPNTVLYFTSAGAQIG